MIDINQKFTLGKEITPEQLNFFNTYGFIHFKSFLDKEEVEDIISRLRKIEQNWIKNGIDKVNGIPIKWGKDENGQPIVQRFAFANKYDDFLGRFLKDQRFELLKSFIDRPDARVAFDEKDGLVVNHYLTTEESGFTKMGWHTDEIRDLFTVGKLNRMLNIGISLDDSHVEKGGLRLIPGTHNQGIWGMFFRKRYFKDTSADKNEIAVETDAGDLTVHCGRIWHRVAASSVVGAASRRRVMYFPIVSGKYVPRTEESTTPLYHRLLFLVK